MDKLDSFEAKQLYQVYMLHQRNLITDHQRGRIKDLIIQKDLKTQQVMQQFLSDRDINTLLDQLSVEDGSPYSPYFSDDCFSQHSSSKYKAKRPSGLKTCNTLFGSYRKLTQMDIRPTQSSVSQQLLKSVSESQHLF